TPNRIPTPIDLCNRVPDHVYAAAIRRLPARRGSIGRAGPETCGGSHGIDFSVIICGLLVF
ncbi:MAG: hypothetical protein ACNA7E_06110, partial [Wenzhouxiangellaceae bacterium]